MAWVRRRQGPTAWLRRAGAAACLALAAASVLPALAGLARLSTLLALQQTGAAGETDFLNLYTGAYLLLHAPRSVYDLGAQLTLQHQLTGRASGIVPFFLPPHAAVLVGWLGLLPYSAAYIVWLLIGVGGVAVSAVWMAPRWGGRWSPLVWTALCMLFLPVFLGVIQGQTSALTLLGMAGLTRCMRVYPAARWRPALAVLTWTLKPQLAPWFIVALFVAGRRWAGVYLAGIIVALSAVAVVVLTPAGIETYSQVSRQKLREVFVSEPGFLPGPTLLHASQWLLGVGWPATITAAVLVLGALAAFGMLWSHGLARGDAMLPQLAALPIISTICAPYALVHELTAWLASFWLLWEYTACRPAARVGLVACTAGVWLAGDLGVVNPVAGGSDLAALLGLCLLWVLAWRARPGVGG